MKLLRAAFFASLALLLLAGLLTGERAIYLLVALGVLLLAAAAGLDLFAFTTFTYRQALDAGTTERGRPVRLTVRVLNERPFPYALLRIRLATADAREDRRIDFNLPQRSEQAFDVVLECPHRGRYTVGMTVIDFVDLFGLMRLPFDLRVLSWYRMPELLVLPRAVELPRLALRTLDGKASSRHAPPSDDPQEPFSDLRAYRPGDSSRRIHWKASLRARALLSRRYDPTEEPQIRVLLDLTPPAHAREEAAQAEDALCEGAASVLGHLLRNHWPVGVATYGRTTQLLASRDPDDLPGLLRWLATVAFDASLPLADQIRLEAASLRDARALLVFTTGDAAGAREALAALKDRVTVHCLVAGPAQDAGRTREAAAELRRAGIAAWALRYGEDPADVMGADP